MSNLAHKLEVQALPYLKLIPLSLAGFIAIMTETMPAGLLTQISSSLGVNESWAGQLITLYALGSVMASIPIIAATMHWRRKKLLLLAVLGFLIFNVITAISTNFILTLIARFFAGMAAGVTWGLLIGYAKRIVSPSQQGRAIAFVGAGQPIALAIGVPLATWLGGIFGWEGAFWSMSTASFLLLLGVAFLLPDFKGIAQSKKSSVWSVLFMQGICLLLAIMFLWIVAHNILFTYIAPYLTDVGMGNKVDVLLMIFGVSSVVGIAVIGYLVDKWLNGLVLICILLFCAGALVLIVGSHDQASVFIGIFLWGLSFGGVPTLLQKKLSDLAGEFGDIAQSMFVTVFNLAVAIGGVVGGVLLEKFGSVSFPWAIVLIAALVCICLRLENKKPALLMHKK